MVVSEVPKLASAADYFFKIGLEGKRFRPTDTMIELEELSTQEGAELMTEDQILAKALGERSGYQKGMGYGVEVPRRNHSWTTTQEDSTIHEKLSETERNLESANGNIQTLTMELEEEKAKRKEYEEKLDGIQLQMQQMQQMMEMLQRNGPNLGGT